MCGIIYKYNFNGEDATRRVLKQFKRQKHRGTTSFGFALPDQHRNGWQVKYRDIVRSMRRTKNPEVLFHHRLSTSTADRKSSCHPFSTKNTFEREWVGVHNGVLFNEHELYKLHKERFGVKYISDNGHDFNDSEAYIYDLASYFEGITEGLEMTGYGAFVMIEYDKATRKKLRLHWGTTSTTSAPLRVHHTANHLDITSEGKGWLVKEDVHYVYEYATGDITMSELVHTPVQSTSRYTYYDPYGYSGDYYDNYGFGAYKNSIDGDSDDVTVWHDDDYLMKPDEHKGYSMFKDGCCEYCDMRMEYFNDYSSLGRTSQKTFEQVLIDRLLEKQKV